MQETFSVASSDDRVMIQKRNRLFQTHKMKMRRFFNLADKSKNGSIDFAPWHQSFFVETSHVRTAGRCCCTLHLEPEEEFKEMTAHKEVSAWLSSMELDVSDPKKLFNLIDGGLKRNLALNWREFARTMHFERVMLRVPAIFARK